MYFLRHDLGEPDFASNPQWLPDPEPEPVPMDVRARGALPVVCFDPVSAGAAASAAALVQAEARRARTKPHELLHFVSEYEDDPDRRSTRSPPLAVLAVRTPRFDAVSPRGPGARAQELSRSAAKDAASDLAQAARRLATARQKARDARLAERMAAEDAARQARQAEVEALRAAKRSFSLDHRGRVIAQRRVNPASLPPSAVEPPVFIVDPSAAPADERRKRRQPQAPARAKAASAAGAAAPKPRAAPAAVLADPLRTVAFTESTKVAPVTVEALKVAPGVLLRTGDRTRVGPKLRPDRAHMSRVEYEQLVTSARTHRGAP